MTHRNNRDRPIRKALQHLTTRQPAKTQRGPAWLTPALIKKVMEGRKILASADENPKDDGSCGGDSCDDDCGCNQDCGDACELDPELIMPQPIIILQPPEDGGARIIRITGAVEYSMVDYVAQKLLDFSDYPDIPILVLITSPGGLLDCGVAIYDYLMTSNLPIITATYGTSSSAAAIIMLAGEERIISSNSTVMIHNISSEYDGLIDKDSVDILHRDFTASQRQIERLIARRTDNSIKQIREWCKVEKQFSARQAVKAGFATRLIQAYRRKSKAG